MRETIQTPSTNPGSVGKFRDEQLPNRLQWGVIPDNEMTLAAMHVVHVVPMNGSTLTAVNPTDPATVADTPGAGVDPAWRIRPGGYGPIVRAGR